MSSVAERKKKIIDLLAEDNTISVTDLSKITGVSTVTIRNDLNSLQEEGVIVRTHGGAAPAFHKDILTSQRTNTEQKMRIAKEAADMIQDGDRVMILGGSTPALITKYLLGKRDVHIVTNSTLALQYSRSNPTLKLTLVGGEFEPTTESLVGPLALATLSKFNVSKCFIGTDGFNHKSGFTANLLETAQVAQQMMEQADECIVVADASKDGKTGFAEMAAFDAVSLLIIDSDLSLETYELLTEKGLNVSLV